VNKRLAAKIVAVKMTLWAEHGELNMKLFLSEPLIKKKDSIVFCITTWTRPGKTMPFFSFLAAIIQLHKGIGPVVFPSGPAPLLAANNRLRILVWIF